MPCCPPSGRARPPPWKMPCARARMIAAPAAAGADLAAALDAFDRVRRPRCRQLAREALLLARLGFELGPGWRQAARNTFLRLLAAGPAFEAGARITRWTPPAVADPGQRSPGRSLNRLRGSGRGSGGEERPGPGRTRRS